MNALSTKWLLVVSLFNLFQENIAQYIPPTPTVEPLHPKGLRMSIPHEDGISLVAYHVKFNEDFDSLEAGTIARDIIKTRNGRWTYEDRSTRLKKGDIIYYWVHVVYDGLGYNLLNKQYTVNDFYNYDGTPLIGTTSAPPTTTCSTPSETTVFDIDEKNDQSRRQNVCQNQLIFEENFDTLNRSQWQIVERYSDAPGYEFVVYMDSEENVQVKEGILHIKPILSENKYGQEFVKTGALTLNNCTGTAGTSECKRKAFGSYILPPVISGRINTKPSFAFLYGLIEIRAKFPRGDWIYPLITLESTEKRSQNSTTYCDIFIALSVGNPALVTRDREDIGGRTLMAGAHIIDLSQSFQQNNRAQLPTKYSNSLWSDDYHLYELEWKSGQVAVIVDGERYGEQKVPALYDTPVYLNLGLAVGGHTLFPDMCVSGNYVKPWRNVASKALYNFYLAQNNWLETWEQRDTGLHVDYIKVWAI